MSPEMSPVLSEKKTESDLLREIPRKVCATFAQPGMRIYDHLMMHCGGAAPFHRVSNYGWELFTAPGLCFACDAHPFSLQNVKVNHFRRFLIPSGETES